MLSDLLAFANYAELDHGIDVFCLLTSQAAVKDWAYDRGLSGAPSPGEDRDGTVVVIDVVLDSLGW